MWTVQKSDVELRRILWLFTVKLENQTFTDENNENSSKKSKLKQKNGLQMIFWGYNISE